MEKHGETWTEEKNCFRQKKNIWVSLNLVVVSAFVDSFFCYIVIYEFAKSGCGQGLLSKHVVLYLQAKCEFG